MAENAEGLDVIKHLLEIEKGASSLIDDAKIEAEKRLASSRSTYNAEYKKMYDQMIVQLESDYKNQISQIESDYNSKIENFKKTLEEKNQNTQKFNSFLESYFFNEN